MNEELSRPSRLIVGFGSGGYVVQPVASPAAVLVGQGRCMWSWRGWLCGASGGAQTSGVACCLRRWVVGLLWWLVAEGAGGAVERSVARLAAKLRWYDAAEQSGLVWVTQGKVHQEMHPEEEQKKIKYSPCGRRPCVPPPALTSAPIAATCPAHY